ncbi:MAG: tRNA (guanosine(37)-N1)-methyltransferase TrmD, partial [Candidatus Falkowbacteria bacterium]|nr:tRNA (guanosine(37)-N1)-methyltransferase TrmD [Candidatus Falkowbacteria bacterium]
MKFQIITIFPKIFDSYFNESILRRAQEKKCISIDIHDLRQWTLDKHKT